jgi:hypothetical protein
MSEESKGGGGSALAALALLAAAGYCACCHAPEGKAPPDGKARPAPRAPDRPEPKRPEPKRPEPRRPLVPRPWRDGGPPSVEGKVSGPSLDGQEVDCDLPGDRHRRNTASKGLGLCVFTSIHHSSDWQNVPALLEFPRWLIDKGIPGGGYPQKVEQLIPRICSDRGVPVPDYLQVEGADLEVLKRACRSGRMPGVTYSFSPTGRYGGGRISHMVSLVSASDQWFVILDNNYPGPDKYEWLTPDEFRRTYAPGGRGWAVILLAPPPPPVPTNK